jgi:hypothetical protein
MIADGHVVLHAIRLGMRGDPRVQHGRWPDPAQRIPQPRTRPAYDASSPCGRSFPAAYSHCKDQ